MKYYIVASHFFVPPDLLDWLEFSYSLDIQFGDMMLQTELEGFSAVMRWAAIFV